MNQIVTQYFDDSSLSGEDGPKLVLITGGTGSGKTTQRKLRYSEGYVLLDAGTFSKSFAMVMTSNTTLGKILLKRWKKLVKTLPTALLKKNETLLWKLSVTNSKL